MNILAIGAHLDDIELACGGTLVKSLKKGHNVKMIVMSKSGYANYNGEVIRQDSVAMKEGRNAAEVMGIHDLEILDFDNKNVPYNSDAVEAIEKRINLFKPDIIFTHWPFDTHQAHVGTANSSISAARRYNTVLLYEPITPSGRSYVAFRPQVYIDISEEIHIKINALKMHETEYHKFGENWIIGINARAAFRGYEMGKDYAEAFEVLRIELDI